MSLETAKDIPGYEGLYKIDTDGNVWSAYRLYYYGRWKPLKPKIDDRGYVSVRLHKSPISRYVTVHRLVWLTFVGIISAGKVIDHIDRNTLNNKLSNLRVASKSQNAQNAKKIKDTVSKFRGVHFVLNKDNHKNPWQARMQLNGKRHYLGHFKSEIAAAIAYDLFVIKECGLFANTNIIHIADRLNTSEVICH
jgi:hypothetical protein